MMHGQKNIKLLKLILAAEGARGWTGFTECGKR